MLDPSGSNWRKWDLQVHTPYSYLNNYFPEDFDKYAEILLNKAIDNNIAAVGITDYFTIDGYKKLSEIISDEEKLESIIGSDRVKYLKEILFLPNIEFRTSTIIRDPEGNDSRVNFHVLFSNEISSEKIEEDFLHRLNFTAVSDLEIEDEQWPLTIRNLTELGRRLKSEHAKFEDFSDIKVGMMNAVIDHKDISKILATNKSIFRDKYLLILPQDEDLSKINWDGQGHLSRKNMIRKSHFLFSANSGTREFGLGKKHPSIEEYIDEFKSLKACIHSSDAHQPDKLFLPDERRFTWIKADPSFAGLKRLKKEPETRVFIGLEPSAITHQKANKTKYIQSLYLRKKEGSDFEENWFDGNEIPINTGLVAIIGNKGSGKSALADTIGLLGNTRREDYFSFLNELKFRRLKENKAAQFEAGIRWLSGDEDECTLSDKVDSANIETIKYIPQSYLEKICNEVASGEGSEFDRELKSVIFSNVSTEERYGRESFDELIKFKTEETYDRIHLLQKNLHQLNQQILSLENKSRKEFQRKLDQQLVLKRSELAAHIKGKPEEVIAPGTDSEDVEANAKLASEINKLRKDLEQTEKKISEISAQYTEFLRYGAVAEKLEAKISNIQNAYNAFIIDSAEECKELKLKIEDVITLTVDLSEIDKIKTDSVLKSAELSDQINPEIEGSQAHTKNNLMEKITVIRQKMDIQNQQYQEYVEALANWETNKKEIEGSQDIPDSIKYIEFQIEQLSSIPKHLKDLREERLEVSKSIYSTISDLVNVYASLYQPILESMDKISFEKEDLHLGFSVQITPKDFVGKFFNLVNQGRKGSFCGVGEGRKRLKRILQKTDFDSWKGVLTFLDNLNHNLRHDVRESNEPDIYLSEITLKGVEEIDIEDFVFSLEYLFPQYALTWGGRTLDQLSPGERGTLLLVFYLLVDKNDVPLVIDQPEENLDNESVVKILVPCIKLSKERRQVIIVTHNPNLAVVCDADQIIYAKMDKSDGNRVSYIRGAIENPEINHHIVDVLEGTRPAFDVRDAKYKIVPKK